MRVLFIKKSGDRKTGPIPVTYTERASCPPTCPLYEGGCYALHHFVGMHWRKLSEGKTGGDWRELCGHVAALPADTFWRHDIAGDLPCK